MRKTHDVKHSRKIMSQNRPSFESLCGCASIILSASQQQYWDSSNPEGRMQLVRSVYNGGADCMIDAGCPLCSGSGVVAAH